MTITYYAILLLVASVPVSLVALIGLLVSMQYHHFTVKELL